MQQAGRLAATGLVLSACCFVMSCGSAPPADEAAASNDSAVYYPINAFIRQQVRQVDTTPYYVYRVLVENGVRDSSTISRSVFDSLAKQFMLPELDEKRLRKDFSEAVYEDQSTNSITLTYTPLDNNTVQNAMVLLDPESQEVKWIFINTREEKGDSTIIQKMGWKGGERAYVNRSVSYAGDKENNRQLEMVWNAK